MRTESAVRVALVRLFATRYGRDVPLDELRQALAAEGIDGATVEATLHALRSKRIAVETPRGWRPVSPPPTGRSAAPMASFSWLHA